MATDLGKPYVRTGVRHRVGSASLALATANQHPLRSETDTIDVTYRQRSTILTPSRPQKRYGSSIWLSWEAIDPSRRLGSADRGQQCCQHGNPTRFRWFFVWFVCCVRMLSK